MTSPPSPTRAAQRRRPPERRRRFELRLAHTTSGSDAGKLAQHYALLALSRPCTSQEAKRPALSGVAPLADDVRRRYCHLRGQSQRTVLRCRVGATTGSRESVGLIDSPHSRSGESTVRRRAATSGGVYAFSPTLSRAAARPCRNSGHAVRVVGRARLVPGWLEPRARRRSCLRLGTTRRV